VKVRELRDIPLREVILIEAGLDQRNREGVCADLPAEDLREEMADASKNIP
jgi:hypothetical protein